MLTEKITTNRDYAPSSACFSQSLRKVAALFLAAYSSVFAGEQPSNLELKDEALDEKCFSFSLDQASLWPSCGGVSRPSFGGEVEPSEASGTYRFRGKEYPRPRPGTGEAIIPDIIQFGVVSPHARLNAIGRSTDAYNDAVDTFTLNGLKFPNIETLSDDFEVHYIDVMLKYAWDRVCPEWEIGPNQEYASVNLEFRLFQDRGEFHRTLLLAPIGVPWGGVAAESSGYYVAFGPRAEFPLYVHDPLLCTIDVGVGGFVANYRSDYDIDLMGFPVWGWDDEIFVYGGYAGAGLNAYLSLHDIWKIIPEGVNAGVRVGAEGAYSNIGDDPTNWSIGAGLEIPLRP